MCFLFLKTKNNLEVHDVGAEVLAELEVVLNIGNGRLGGQRLALNILHKTSRVRGGGEGGLGDVLGDNILMEINLGEHEAEGARGGGGGDAEGDGAAEHC